ncbi:hypothetical protein ACFQZX_13995 [Mucilaginibacter litoreus]|uniref:Auto-transporter adhesin head GIN domain-containing protein n=1 Tax=Mucilaginibacter litoreus TaxID=1048221 RepID=A0ABW3AWQ4_9SPHI
MTKITETKMVLKLRNFIFTLLLMCFFCVPGKVAAQENQRPDSDTTYRFVKTPLVKLFVSSGEDSKDSSQLLVQGVRQGSRRLLTFIIQNVKTGEFFIQSGQKVYIYVNNGSTVQLNAQSTAFSTFGGMGYGNYLAADYALSVYDLDFFKVDAVSNIQLQYSGGSLEFDLSIGQSDALKSVLEQIR